MNLSFRAHIKKEIIMELDTNECAGVKNNNELEFRRIDEGNIKDFANDDFISTSMMQKGRYIGAYEKGKPIGFASLVYRGEKGDYFNIKKCDLYLQKLYIFPDYRGRRIMQDIIIYCLTLPTPDGSAPQKVSLCVRPDNIAAIKCYKRVGFKIMGSKIFFRLCKDIVFPRHII